MSARALTLPLTFTLLLVALGLLPGVRQQSTLLWSFWSAGAVLVAWNAVLLAASRGRNLTIEVSLRTQHYVQACAHLSILIYWGWYWRQVYDSAPLIAAQLVFAYAFDALLAWSRRDTYTLGFGPFPIIFSTNLFLWFKPDWFYLQFLLVAVGLTVKELIRWEKDGRRVHIFNPSSFPLALVSVILLLTGTTNMTWGPEIASTQFNPPYIYLIIFLVALPGQFLFGVASMTLSAVATLYAFCLGYFLATGSHYFLELPIPIAIFLGMHLLFTDPSTSPRTELGRLIFGVLYGSSVLALFVLLDRLGVPTFYDKLLPVPILNLTIQGIDKAARSNLLKRFDPGTLGRGLTPRLRNLAYMSVWVMIFVTMQVLTGTEVTLARGDSLKAQGRLDEAIARYREFLQTDPADFDGQSKLAAALLQAGRPEDAVLPLQRAAELKPNSPEAHDTLGITLIKTGRFQEAIRPLQRAAELQPDSAKTLTELALALMQAGRLDDAVASLRRAVELQPESPEANNALGKALMDLGQLDDAVPALRRAVELQPNSLEAYNNLGAALMREGRFDDAIRSLQRPIELHPDNPEAHNNLGVALIQAGRVEDAVASFQRAVDLQPENADAHHALGVTLIQAGRAADAVPPLRRAVELRPDFAEALTSLAWLEATEGDGLRDPGDAVRLASRAADLSGRRDARVLDVLAAAYAAAGRFTEASRTAEAAEAIASGSAPDLAPQIRTHLSLYRTGRSLIVSDR